MLLLVRWVVAQMVTEQEIRELTLQAKALVNKIDDLVGGTGTQMIHLSKTARTNRRMIWALIFSCTLELILTVLVGYNLVRVVDNSNSIREIQTSQRRDALCPLYQQFINADTPKAREAAKANGQDLETREHAFQVIRNGYAALNCSEFEGK